VNAGVDATQSLHAFSIAHVRNLIDQQHAAKWIILQSTKLAERRIASPAAFRAP